MPQRITRSRSYSHRTLFGGRVTTRVTTTQTFDSPRPQTPASVYRMTYSPEQLLAMQQAQMQRLAAAREQDIAQQQAHMEALALAPRGFSPLAIARWLHTTPGALTTLGVFVVGLVLGFSLDLPFVIFGEMIALAIVDWQNVRTMHGAIGWRQWGVNHRGLAWFVGFLLVCYGWLFLPVVYAIQSWNRAAEVRQRTYEYQQARISKLEAEVFGDRHLTPPASTASQGSQQSSTLSNATTTR